MIAFYRLALAALGLASAIAAWMSPAFAQSNSSAPAPFSSKAFEVESLRLPADFAIVTPVLLEPIDPGLIDAARAVNAKSWNKRLQIGIGRSVDASLDASSQALRWAPTPGGIAAHWEITSPDARALRIGLAVDRMQPGVEIRFVGRGQPDTVYGPFTARNVVPGSATYWSPVLEGESAIVEVFVAWGESPAELTLAITQVSHLFVSPSNPAAENIAKASQSCEVDFICRAASDTALANTGRAVARMTFSDGFGGGQFLCTGTLLNPIGGSFTPYFYSASHCMSTQASASTLTTHWFYDRTGCGTGSISPNYVQLPGGATLLYADAFADALLLRLNGSPPPGAVFSGWDATTLSAGTALTAVHHPAGDLKKVSLGTMGGFGSFRGSGSNFMVANWNSTATGVTEGGSSGSGIFTATGSGYLFRGGLFGGPSSCSAPASDLHDYYSRLDQVYPSIAQYLNPGTVSCSYALSPTSVTVGANATTGSSSVTASSGCAWTATSDASWLTTSSSGNGNGTVTYSVAANTGTSRVGTITIAGHTFTVTQQTPVNAGTNLVTNPGFETGNASWSQSATGGAPIIYTDATIARSGSWYAWLGGYDNGTDTMYQEVTIPAGATQAMLRFWYRIITTEGETPTAYDTMKVAIDSATTGERLATLATLSNANQTSGWVQSQQYDVSAFAGQTVRLVFTATMDISSITNFFVDDITLTALGSGAAPNYTALWWNPSESGWGINFNHQGNIVFATLFTYDLAGNPMWLVMSNGAKQSGETFSGALYRTTGPAFDANPFTPIGASNLATVGTMTVTFSGRESRVRSRA